MSYSTLVNNRIRMSKSTIIFNIIGYSILSVLALLCIFPFIMLLSGSFTAEQSIAQYGYGIIPREFSTNAYNLLFKNPGEIVHAYGVTIFITAAGTFFGLFVTSMTAYVLSRQDFKYRNGFSFFFYFTTLFNGGTLTIYIFFVKYLNLKDSYLALILPLLINVFYLLIMRSFMASIPSSIIESAKIDGAGEFLIYVRLILPLSKSGLTTIGLFILLGYWNDWYNAMLYISDYKMYPLQYMLYNMLSATEAISRISSSSGIEISNMPAQSLKMAMAVIATGPVLLVYPFVQKYFVKGITIGAVKG